MNNLLYKYMCLRSDFFLEPKIRATPIVDLNDPYEGRFNATQITNANKHYHEHGKKLGLFVSDMQADDVSEMMMNLSSDMHDVGIISLSEENNELLMWAHYADEHKGMVIEFDFEKPFFMDSIKEVSGRKSRFGLSSLGDFFEFPENVLYEKLMPVFSKREDILNEDNKEFYLKKLYKNILFTKSISWQYEKEKRSVVQLQNADEMIFDYNHLNPKDKVDITNHIKELCDKDKSIQCEITDDNNRVTITYPHEYEMHEDMGDCSLRFEIYMAGKANSAQTICLFRINPLSISKVFFGVNADESLAIKNILSNETLCHLVNNLYKCDVDDYEYSLIMNKINV